MPRGPSVLRPIAGSGMEIPIEGAEDLPFLVGVKVLRAAGAVEIRARYEWENDQGELSSPWALDVRGQKVRIPPQLYAGIEKVLWKELEARDHAYGDIRINLDTLEGTHESYE